MPHVLAADLAAADSLALRELARRVLWYLIERGDARTPRDLMSNLRQQWRDRLGEDHQHTLMAAHYLAWALLEMGRDAEFRDLNQDTLARRRRVLGEDHPDTLPSVHVGRRPGFLPRGSSGSSTAHCASVRSARPVTAEGGHEVSVQMVFLVVDSSTGDLAQSRSATRGHFRPSQGSSSMDSQNCFSAQVAIRESFPAGEGP
jgi:hypothetical protein